MKFMEPPSLCEWTSDSPSIAAFDEQVWPWSVVVSSAPIDRLELVGVAPTLAAGTTYRFRATAS